MDNFNSEIEKEIIYQVEAESEPVEGKKQKKIWAKVEKNLTKIIVERLSGRIGEC